MNDDDDGDDNGDDVDDDDDDNDDTMYFGAHILIFCLRAICYHLIFIVP